MKIDEMNNAEIEEVAISFKRRCIDDRLNRLSGNTEIAHQIMILQDRL